MSLESCGLLNLPREIRDMIYVHVMNLNSPDPTAYDVLVGFWGSPGSTKRPSFLPAICAVNKQLYEEATLKFIQSRCFILYDSGSSHFMDNWLENLDKGLENIRSLNFYQFRDHYMGQRPLWDLHILLRCKNLTSLHLNFRQSVSCENVVLQQGGLAASESDLPSLKKLVVLEKLRKFSFTLAGQERQSVQDFGSMLKEWLWGENGACGKKDVAVFWRGPNGVEIECI